MIETGTSRKLRLPDNVVQEFFAALQEVESAETIHDLWKRPKRKFEKLRGHASRYSMRLTGKYRLEMEVTWTNAGKTVGIFLMDEISNHYGD